MRPDSTAIPARLANRLLHDHSWARARLAPLAGRTFSLTVGPMHAAWRITDDGTLDVAPAASEPDLKLTVSPWSLPAFLANPARWNEFVREDGDATEVDQQAVTRRQRQAGLDQSVSVVGSCERATDRHSDVMSLEIGVGGECR